MTLQPWLVEHIKTTTGAAPGARTARTRRCPDCHAHTLVGLDNDWAAMSARVDPAPLGYQGEALARLAGRATYALRRRGNTFRLARRDRWQIGARRNWPSPYDVVAEHACHISPLPEITSAYKSNIENAEVSDVPPF
jgi:hypothetical protein